MANDIAELSRLTPAKGSVKNNKRIGRGRGSGHGDTATKGHKGAKSRSGYSLPTWFEGGQMPIQRRLPKRGFTQTNRTEYNEVNVGGLARVEGGICDPTTLRRAGLVKGRGPVAVLGVGEVTQPLTVKAHRVTKSAQEKIIAAGGTVELLEVEAEFRRVKKGPAPKVSTRKRNQKSSGE